MFEVTFVYNDKTNPSLCNSWEDEYDEMKDVIEDIKAMDNSMDYIKELTEWTAELDYKKHNMSEKVFNYEDQEKSLFVNVTQPSYREDEGEYPGKNIV